MSIAKTEYILFIFKLILNPEEQLSWAELYIY